MNKKLIIIVVIFSVSLLIGIADFATSVYGYNIGLIEANGLYIPFLSTIVLFSVGLFADYLYRKMDEKDKKFFGYFSIFSLSFLSVSMIIPIINNVSLII